MADNFLGDLFDSDSKPVFIDGDTVKDIQTGNSLRIQGVNTPEVSKLEDDKVVPGEIGGQLTASYVGNLAQKEGFTQPVITQEKLDPFGRAVGDLVNPETGEKLSSKLLESGLADLTLFSDKSQINQALLGRLDRAQRKLDNAETEWDIAGDLVREQRKQYTELEAKPLAVSEQQYAIAPDLFSPSGVQIRSPLDRTLDNKATNSISTAFALGMANIEEGAWGAWDLIGDTLGFDDTGKPNVDRVQREISRLPELENQIAFDEEGNWRLNSASQFVDYIFTNAAMSAPYMISSILSVALAPATYGTSLAIPSIVYTGQTYNAQERKDPTSAIASGIGQGVLERIGLKGVTSASKNFIKDSAVRSKVINDLAKQKFKGNLQLAEASLGNETIKELLRISKSAKDALALEFRGKYLDLGKGTGKAVLRGGASEALTETGQEVLASLGEKSFDINAINTDELSNRLLNAAVAGFTLGGTLSGTGQVKENLNVLGALSGYDKADPTKTTVDTKYREQAIREGATQDQLNIDFVASNIDQDYADLNEMAQPELERKTKRNVIETLRDVSKGGIGQLWRGLANQLHNRFGNRGENVRKALALINGNNVYYGGGIEDSQHLTESSLNNIVGSEQEALNKFQVRSLQDITNFFANKDIINLFDKISNEYNKGKYLNFKETFNNLGLKMPQGTEAQQEAFIDYAERFYNYNKKVEQLTGESKNILTQKTFNKVQIAKNMGEFVEALEAAGIAPKDAESLAFDILDIENIQEADDLFNTDIFNTPLDKSNVDLMKLRQSPELAKYLNDDIFYNMAAINGSTAARLANAKFLGKDGAKLAYYLKKATEANELTPEEASYLAAEFKDYIDIRKGEYKRIESPLWRSFQQNALFLTTLNQLPLATVSSIVELSLVSNSLNKNVIFDKGFIKDAAKEAAKEFGEYYNDGVFRATRGRVKRADTITTNKKRNDLFQLGFLQESQSVAQKNDVNAGVNKQRAINSFFKLIGLQGLTNYTRSMRLSLAGDAIHGWVYDVATEGEFPTKQSMEAREALLDLGLDIQFMVDIYNNPNELSPEQQTKYDEQMRLASFRFVNQAIAHPTKSNRPKFYQNPRTALFFQFQGFISTFTSTILPRIYRRLFNSNTPLDSRINTIGTIATLLFLGFLSQYLRDLVKYGEETPYLDDFEKFQRAVGASGLMGSGERIVNTVFPLYDTRSDGWLDLALDEISGQAPVLGYGGRVTTAVDAIFSGADNAPSRIQKAAPLVGPINQLGWELDDIF